MSPDSGQAGAEPARDTRSVPVAVRLTGQPTPGWELAGPVRVEPVELTVTGPPGAVARLDTIRLPAIRLDGRTVSATVDIDVDTTGLGLQLTPMRVKVTIPIRQIPTEAGGGGPAPRPDPAWPPAGTRT